VGFTVPPGELVGVVGANGSGKSTLLRVLSGLVEADGGTARVLGRHPRAERDALRAETGYAGQEVALDPEMTGGETLRLFYALRGLPHGERGRRLAGWAREGRTVLVATHDLAEVAAHCHRVLLFQGGRLLAARPMGGGPGGRRGRRREA
jgi:ABC-type multidrug transport system ATPase subunit